MKADTALGFAKLAAAGLAIYLGWRVYRKATGAVGEAFTTDNGGFILNPANPQNPVNEAAVGVYQWLTGSQGTIGTDIYNYTHNDDGSVKGWSIAKLFGGPLTWAAAGAYELATSTSTSAGPVQLGGVVLPASAYASESAWLQANVTQPVTYGY